MRINMAWGLQKLGQPIISVGGSSATTAPADVGTLFGRKYVVTNGNDERSLEFGNSSDNAKENYYEDLSNLDLNFRKQKLLAGLTGEFSSVAKLDAVSKAATLEGLLPSSFSSASIGVGNLMAGGLTQEWDFDFGN
jgi:hypothetical protein